MEEIKIRTPQSHDYVAWSKLYQLYLEFYQTSLREDELKKVWSWLFEPNHFKLHCYFAEIENEIVGLAHFREYIRPIKASTGIYLDDLIVLPQFHGKGVGYKLLEAIKCYAKHHGFSLVRWMTAPDNQKAMKLYDSVAKKTTWIAYDANIDIL